MSRTYTTGWIRDLPDRRDWDAGPLLKLDRLEDKKRPELPPRKDAREHCSPIEDQKDIGSCTAQSIVGMAEYMERRLYGNHVNGSRLFLYKMARELDGYKGDVGAQLRTAMKAFKIFGTPPERYWPYITSKYDHMPTPFVFALGQAFQALEYARIDVEGRSREDVLHMIKQLLFLDHPVVFGFLVFTYGNNFGEFRLPKIGESPSGGHAVMAVGYDDDREIEGSKGALMLRNSWGIDWGENGYGWLPYDYILHFMSNDFWTLFKKETVLE
jgi:C1A family cysteine protease